MSNYIERYWRDATPADAIREPPMVARFQDNDYGFWVIGELIYWDRSEVPWYREKYVGYERCQVYDAPDPGEGWRLVDVDSEKPQAGDEFKFGSGWVYCNEFLRDTWYASNQVIRRRIEQPKPEPRYEPFRWEDRQQLLGRGVRCVYIANNEWIITSIYIARSGELHANGIPANRLLTSFVFVDTGEPVGKKILE